MHCVTASPSRRQARGSLSRFLHSTYARFTLAQLTERRRAIDINTADVGAGACRRSSRHVTAGRSRKQKGAGPLKGVAARPVMPSLHHEQEKANLDEKGQCERGSRAIMRVSYARWLQMADKDSPARSGNATGTYGLVLCGIACPAYPKTRPPSTHAGMHTCSDSAMDKGHARPSARTARARPPRRRIAPLWESGAGQYMQLDAPDPYSLLDSAISWIERLRMPKKVRLGKTGQPAWPAPALLLARRRSPPSSSRQAS